MKIFLFTILIVSVAVCSGKKERAVSRRPPPHHSGERENQWHHFKHNPAILAYHVHDQVELLRNSTVSCDAPNSVAIHTLLPANISKCLLAGHADSADLWKQASDNITQNLGKILSKAKNNTWLTEESKEELQSALNDNLVRLGNCVDKESFRAVLRAQALRRADYFVDGLFSHSLDQFLEPMMFFLPRLVHGFPAGGKHSQERD